MPCTNVYPVSELIVLHLCATNDANGNPRRVFVLAHGLKGYLAATDEGYSGTGALADFAVGFEDDKAAIVAELRKRVTPRIEITPKERRHLLSKPVQTTMAERITIITL